MNINPSVVLSVYGFQSWWHASKVFPLLPSPTLQSSLRNAKAFATQRHLAVIWHPKYIFSKHG